MQPWVAAAGMKKKPAPKNGSSHTVTILGSGIQRTSGQSCGICLTEEKIWANTLEYSPSATGLKWTFGNTFYWKTLKFRTSISHTNAEYSTVMVYGLPKHHYG